MNNTKTTPTIVAVIMAATLVVGTFATVAVTQQSAFAIAQKKPPGHDGSKKKTTDNGKGNDNGNTITALKCQNKGSASGFDTALDQECENLICTHPGNNATCSQEGVISALPTPTPTSEPITTTLRIIKQVVCLPTDPNCSLPDVCEIDLSIFTPDNPKGNTQSFTCQSAVGNGLLFTLQPGSFFSLTEVQGPPFFDVTRNGDCDGTIAAGQHLICTITNTEPGDT
jgi:hypothetical protein